MEVLRERAFWMYLEELRPNMVAFLCDLLDKAIKGGVTEHKGYSGEIGEVPYYVHLDDVVELRDKLHKACSRKDMLGTTNVNPDKEYV